MSEWTPGPWTIRRRKVRNRDLYHRHIMAGTMPAMDIAKLRTSSRVAENHSGWLADYNDAAMEANAHLIAAAPALYAALRALVVEDPFSGAWVTTDATALNQAVNALALANGDLQEE